MPNDQTVLYIYCKILQQMNDADVAPSISIACPDDLEQRAPDVSMKNTWMAQVLFSGQY